MASQNFNFFPFLVVPVTVRRKIHTMILLRFNTLGCLVSKVANEYYALYGENISPEMYGYPSMESMIKSLEPDLKLSGNKANRVVKADPLDQELAIEFVSKAFNLNRHGTILNNSQIINGMTTDDNVTIQFNNIPTAAAGSTSTVISSQMSTDISANNLLNELARQDVGCNIGSQLFSSNHNPLQTTSVLNLNSQNIHHHDSQDMSVQEDDTDGIRMPPPPPPPYTTTSTPNIIRRRNKSSETMMNSLSSSSQPFQKPTSSSSSMNNTENSQLLINSSSSHFSSPISVSLDYSSTASSSSVSSCNSSHTKPATINNNKHHNDDDDDDEVVIISENTINPREQVQIKTESIRSVTQMNSSSCISQPLPSPPSQVLQSPSIPTIGERNNNNDETVDEKPDKALLDLRVQSEQQQQLNENSIPQVKVEDNSNHNDNNHDIDNTNDGAQNIRIKVENENNDTTTNNNSSVSSISNNNNNNGEALPGTGVVVKTEQKDEDNEEQHPSSLQPPTSLHNNSNIIPSFNSCYVRLEKLSHDNISSSRQVKSSIDSNQELVPSQNLEQMEPIAGPSPKTVKPIISLENKGKRKAKEDNEDSSCKSKKDKPSLKKKKSSKSKKTTNQSNSETSQNNNNNHRSEVQINKIRQSSSHSDTGGSADHTLDTSFDEELAMSLHFEQDNPEIEKWNIECIPSIPDKNSTSDENENESEVTEPNLSPTMSATIDNAIPSCSYVTNPIPQSQSNSSTDTTTITNTTTSTKTSSTTIDGKLKTPEKNTSSSSSSNSMQPILPIPQVPSSICAVHTKKTPIAIEWFNYKKYVKLKELALSSSPNLDHDYHRYFDSDLSIHPLNHPFGEKILKLKTIRKNKDPTILCHHSFWNIIHKEDFMEDTDVDEEFCSIAEIISSLNFASIQLSNVDAAMNFELTNFPSSKNVYVVSSYGYFLDYFLWKNKENVIGILLLPIDDEKLIVESLDRYKNQHIFQGGLSPVDLLDPDHGGQTKKDFKDYVNNLAPEDVDLFIANGMGYPQKNYRPQDLFIVQLLLAMEVLKDDGIFIIKVEDTITLLATDLIFLMSKVFKKIAIYKPESALPGERFIIGNGKKSIHQANTDLVQEFLQQCHVWRMEQQLLHNFDDEINKIIFEDQKELPEFSISMSDDNFINYMKKVNESIADREILEFEEMENKSEEQVNSTEEGSLQQIKARNKMLLSWNQM